MRLISRARMSFATPRECSQADEAGAKNQKCRWLRDFADCDIAGDVIERDGTLERRREADAVRPHDYEGGNSEA